MRPVEIGQVPSMGNDGEGLAATRHLTHRQIALDDLLPQSTPVGRTNVSTASGERGPGAITR